MRILTPALALLLVACGAESPTIDGASVDRFAASLVAIRGKLDVPTRTRFDAAIAVAEAEAFYASRDHATFERALRDRLDGMTASEVIETVSITGHYDVRLSPRQTPGGPD